MTTPIVDPAAAPVVAPAPLNPVLPGIQDGKVPAVDTNTPVKTKEEFVAEKKAAEDKTLADAKAIKDAADAAKAAEREGWQKEYIKVENPDAQAAIDLMNEAGVSPVEANAIFAKAVESGNLKDVDWATLEAKIGATKARLVRNGVEKYHSDVVSVQNKAKAEAYEITGGEENWNTIRTWAQTREKADATYAAKVADYRKAMDAGGFAAKAAVQALKADYEADPKNGGLGQKTITRGDAPAVASAAPLSRMDYLKALKAAEFSRAPAPVLEALHNRRRAGMAAGI